MIELDAKLIWDVFVSTLAGIAAAYAFFATRNRANAANISNVSVRLAAVETRLADMPTHKDLSDLSTEVTRLSGESKSLGRSLDGLKSLLSTQQGGLDRIHNFLLTKDAK